MFWGWLGWLERLKTLASMSKQTHRAKIVAHVRDLKRFARKYWFVVLPLHGVLTVAYVGVFYLGSRQTQCALQLTNIPQDDVRSKYFPNIPKRTLEDVAITLVLMKVSAPLRYASTFVGSKYLVELLRSRRLINCLPIANGDACAERLQ